MLAKAVATTFANRETAIEIAPIALTPEFTEQTSTLAQWTAFRRMKPPNTECPETLAGDSGLVSMIEQVEDEPLGRRVLGEGDAPEEEAPVTQAPTVAGCRRHRRSVEN